MLDLTVNRPVLKLCWEPSSITWNWKGLWKGYGVPAFPRSLTGAPSFPCSMLNVQMFVSCALGRCL